MADTRAQLSEGESKREPVWNSLEIAKLAINLSTPMIVALVSLWIHSSLKNIEQNQWANQKVIEQRIRFSQEYGDPLNDLFCYYTYVGGWKELRPLDIVTIKRKLDKLAYVNAPIFPADFLDRHNKFMDLLYKTHQGWGVDAKLRTRIDRRKEAYGAEWDGKWESLFVPDEAPDPENIRAAYAEQQEYIARSIGIGLRGLPDVPAVLPGNAR